MKIRAWLERVDPGTHRRIKGLRLVTAYGIAWMMGTLEGRSIQLPGHNSLSALAAGFALWASVSEGRTTRAASSRDLLLLVLAAVLGAATMMDLAPILARVGRAGPEFTLVIGAFCVAYLKPVGILAAGLGSQFYIGQLLAYGVGSTPNDLAVVAIAGLIAAVAAIVPRLVSGPAEHPGLPAPTASDAKAERRSPGLRMGLQAAAAALVIVVCNEWFGLEKSAWAVTACTYVIAGTMSGTVEKVFAPDRRNSNWRPPWSRLSAICIALTLSNLYRCSGCHGCLRDGAPGTIRHCLRGIRIRTHRDDGGARRKLGDNARLPRLGDLNRGRAWSGHCYAHLSPSSTTASLAPELEPVERA